MIKAFLLGLLSFGLSTSALADAVPGTANTAVASTDTTVTLAASAANAAPIASTGNTGTIVQSNAPAPSSLIEYCPSINQLVKDNAQLTWSAPGGWQGYQKSFAVKLSHFTGVQWAGIKVGQVICTYKAAEEDTFPIQLVYSKLVLQPSGGAWGQNMGGYINCKSNNVNDCPFPVQLTQQTDILQEAAEIKPQQPDQEQAF